MMIRKRMMIRKKRKNSNRSTQASLNSEGTCCAPPLGARQDFLSPLKWSGRAKGRESERERYIEREREKENMAYIYMYTCEYQRMVCSILLEKSRFIC